MKKFDAVVYGGGIIGALSAYEISKSGKRVLLLEKNKFGYGASGNSAAMLELQIDAYRGEPFLSLARASHDLFPSVAQELKEKSGVDIHFERCSILQVALNAGEAGFLEKECARQSGLGLKAQWLSKVEIAKRFPALTRESFGGALFHEDGRVNGNLFLKAALDAARNSGVAIEESVDRPIIDYLKTGAKIIVATGAWADEVLKPLGVRLGVAPVRGQLMMFETPTPPLPFPVYTKSGGYLTPRADGTTLAGTTVENAGFDSTPTEEGRAKITNIVKSLMPSLLERPVLKMTAGLRPKSPDDLPLLGPLPDHPDVIIAAGHYRNGILLAPITAKIMGALLAGKKSPVGLDPFLPSRVFLSA